MGSKPSATIKTRLLILSDTHGTHFEEEEKPLSSVDVAIHCGDLTQESKLDEFRAALHLLQDIDAPLKLVIAGNHDFTMDLPMFQKKVTESEQPLEPELVAKVYGKPGEARRLFEDAELSGIIFLDEGTHRFELANGARLIVYASPYTPSYGDWGFQYRPNESRVFEIDQVVDIVVTHGPPRGIMDYTSSGERAGCKGLFAAVARARPRVHCFGHIHEGWGAKLVTWRDETRESPSHLTDIDNENSVVIENLTRLRGSKFDTPETLEEKLERRELYRRERCCRTSHCSGDEHSLRWGEQTLFVNAAIQGDPIQLPWLLELDLPKAD